jgi:DNA-binding HxlR family transcriptional regulator
MDAKRKLEHEFGDKGMLGILIALGGYQNRFSEIAGFVNISQSTLSKRLKEGIERDLWHKEHIDEGEARDWIKYSLTEKGEVYYSVAEENNLPDAKENLDIAEFRYNLAENNFFCEFVENPEKIPPMDETYDG